MSLITPEVLPGATPAGLHLVGDEQDPAVGKLLRERSKHAIRWGREAADTLDRLSDKTGDIPGRGHVEELHEVSGARRRIGVVVEIRERRPQSITTLHELHLETADRGRRPTGVGSNGLRRERTSVVRVAHREHLIRLPETGGEQQGRVVGLGARGGEEHSSIGNARHLRDHLGELDHRLREVQGRGVEHLAGLFTDRRRDMRVVVADHRGQHPSEEIEVAVAGRIPYLRATASVDLDRFCVQRGDERREYASVSIQKGVFGRLRAHAIETTDPTPARPEWSTG